MINLLPPNQKRNLQAARTNSLLVRYNFGLLAGLGALVLIIGFSYAVLMIGQNNAETTIADNNKKLANYDKVKQDGTTFAQNLSTAKQIFASNTDYVNLLIKIAHTLPSHAILESLTLDPTTVGKPTTLTAQVSDTATALSLKNAFAANSSLFSNVYLTSITGGGSAPYPYTVILNVTVNAGALK